MEANFYEVFLSIFVDFWSYTCVAVIYNSCIMYKLWATHTREKIQRKCDNRILCTVSLWSSWFNKNHTSHKILPVTEDHSEHYLPKICEFVSSSWELVVIICWRKYRTINSCYTVDHIKIVAQFLSTRNIHLFIYLFI